jgi:hypothetical protein
MKARSPVSQGWQNPAGPSDQPRSGARKVLGWPKRCNFSRAFLWEYSYARLQLAQVLGHLDVFLTWSGSSDRIGWATAGRIGIALGGRATWGPVALSLQKQMHRMR